MSGIEGSEPKADRPNTPKAELQTEPLPPAHALRIDIRARRDISAASLRSAHSGQDGGLIVFAVVRTGGKQYRIRPGSVVRVERLNGEAGDAVELGEVLAIGEGEKFRLGTPTVAGASVAATVISQERDKKILILKKRRRKNSRRRQGHRQEVTVLRIGEIKTGEGDGA